MGILQKKCRTTAKKALAYRVKSGQDTDTAFLAIWLGVVLNLPIQQMIMTTKWALRSLGKFISCDMLQSKSTPWHLHGGSEKKGSFGKGVVWKRGLFIKVHFLEILENLEILEILETPQTVENK